MFIDYAGQTVTGHAPEGEFEAQLFVAVLAASSYTYVEASRWQDLRSWLASHGHALHFSQSALALPIRGGGGPQLPPRLPIAPYRETGAGQLLTPPSRALANRHPLRTDGCPIWLAGPKWRYLPASSVPAHSTLVRYSPRRSAPHRR